MAKTGRPYRRLETIDNVMLACRLFLFSILCCYINISSRVPQDGLQLFSCSKRRPCSYHSLPRHRYDSFNTSSRLYIYSVPGCIPTWTPTNSLHRRHLYFSISHPRTDSLHLHHSLPLCSHTDRYLQEKKANQRTHRRGQ